MLLAERRLPRIVAVALVFYCSVQQRSAFGGQCLCLTLTKGSKQRKHHNIQGQKDVIVISR